MFIKNHNISALCLILILTSTNTGSDSFAEDAKQHYSHEKRVIRFDFEGTSRQTRGAGKDDETLEYIWGEFESDGDDFHLIRHSTHLIRSDGPVDKSRFRLEMSESVGGKDGKLSSGKTIEIQMAYPNNLEKAKEVAELALEKKSDVPNGFVFDDSIARIHWIKAASEFPFLGHIAGNSILQPTDGVEGNRSGTIDLGSRSISWQLNEVGLVSAFEITMRPVIAEPTDKNADPFARRIRGTGGGSSTGSLTANQDGFNYTSSGESRTSSGSSIQTSEELEIRNIAFESTSPFEFQNAPEEGSDVILINSQQIDAQWRDGKIARIYDGGVAENLAEAEFRTPSNSYKGILATGVIASLAAVIWWLSRNRGRGKS